MNALICERCGAQLTRTETNEIAECLFCGSEHLLSIEHAPTDQFPNLTGGANVTHFSPTIPSSDVMGIINRAIKSEE